MVGDRTVTELPLPHFLKVALVDNGYKTTGDLASISAADLAIELSVGIAQAEDIVRLAANSRSSHSSPKLPDLVSQVHTSTASALLQTDHVRFSTQSLAVDEALSHFAPSPLSSFSAGSAHPLLNLRSGPRVHPPGAITPGMVVEVSGPPGSGKTAMALSVALGCRLAKNEASASGDSPPESDAEVLLVDTEGAMSAGRVMKAAQALVEDTDPLEGMHLIRVATQMQMVSLLHTLGEWLERHPKVKVIVIDTLSFHFRQPSLEIGARKRIMDLVKLAVGKAATVHSCAVIITNQLATKLLTSENKPAKFETGERAVLMPQLGDAWTTERTLRVTLFRGGAGDDLRYAHISQATSSVTGGVGNRERESVPWAPFDIDNVGLLCDVPQALPQELANYC